MAESTETIKCNYATNELSEAEISRIEAQCKEQRHITETSSLLDLIKADEEVVRTYGFTFEQLGNFFRKIQMHFYRNINDDKTEVVLSDAVSEKLSQIKLGGPGWSCWSNNRTTIFNGQITVIRVTWGGAERCPFQSTEDDRYHGYEYGSHDWMFINNLTLATRGLERQVPTEEIMHIGDLLFHQISVHHFFQHPESKYRVDPEKLIKFFGLKNNLSYEVETETYEYWTIKSEITCLKKFYPDNFYSPDPSMTTERFSAFTLPDVYKRTVYGKNIVVEYGDTMIIYKNECANFPDHMSDICKKIVYRTEYESSGVYSIGIYELEKKKASRSTDKEMTFSL
jgi:hypothetical protein